MLLQSSLAKNYPYIIRIRRFIIQMNKCVTSVNWCNKTCPTTNKELPTERRVNTDIYNLQNWNHTVANNSTSPLERETIGQIIKSTSNFHIFSDASRIGQVSQISCHITHIGSQYHACQLSECAGSSLCGKQHHTAHTHTGLSRHEDARVWAFPVVWEVNCQKCTMRHPHFVWVSRFNFRLAARAFDSLGSGFILEGTVKLTSFLQFLYSTSRLSTAGTVTDNSPWRESN